MFHDAIEEPFCLNGSIKNLLFHKRLFLVKECSSDYKKIHFKFFKEPLTEGFFVEPKIVCHRCDEPFEAPLLLRVK